MSIPNVEIISASAGTGKTTELARFVADSITEGDARPDAILATTFTNRAAADLTERARERLLQNGRFEEAQQLAASRIGTVNAVCGRIVQDFAFEKGLSPRLRVLDERQASGVLRTARAHAVGPEVIEELGWLSSRMRDFDFDRNRLGEFDWQRRVQHIIELARANGITAQGLRDCSERSWKEMQALLGPREPDADALDRALDEALTALPRNIDREVDATGVTEKALQAAEKSQRTGARSLTWSDWLGLQQLKVGARSRDAAAPLRAAAAKHDVHPRLHDDTRRIIELVFQVAAETLHAYQQHKKQLGVIDFVDQERYALELLAEEPVRERLGEELDLVLVDEFQDTSPIQLAIFLELAKIAKRSVWVGDPKQAIYGFRGADPALMDAAVEQLLAGSRPKTLRVSYRSREALVAATSELFARAFEPVGIGPDLVHVESHRTQADEPLELGTAFERWTLEKVPNQNGRPSLNIGITTREVAAGVKALLAGPDLQVLDRATHEPRPANPGDVAVLCLRHRHCRDIADELARLGLRAVVARPGLMATLEGRLAGAALRLWLDPRDDLARAELARWIAYPTDGDAWLAALLQARSDDEPPFGLLPEVAALAEARAQAPDAGVLAALDSALEATRVRHHCLALGDAELRLANVDALRATAAEYVDWCRAEAIPCTMQGLLIHLDELARSESDMQAANASPDAVVVTTWHGAKGLEWPIAILADLCPPKEASALDVALVADRERLDLENPLQDRWIRFLPDLYRPKRTNAPLHARLQAHPMTQRAAEAAQRENLRLLYVAWTRARDRLVLVAENGGLAKQHFGILKDEDGALLSEPDGKGQAVWRGREMGLGVRSLTPAVEEERAREVGRAAARAGVRRHAPATASPSQIERMGEVREVVELGERLVLGAGARDMAVVGDAVHSFLGADRRESDAEVRTALAAECLERFGVAGVLEPAGLVRASDSLQGWIEARWPGATCLREYPVQRRLDGGTVLRGRVDLLIDTGDGLVVVDHKSFPGGRAQAVERAKAFVGQLEGYGEALGVALGKPVVGMYVHLPVVGLLVAVG